jgi:hypothetical protein
MILNSLYSKAKRLDKPSPSVVVVSETVPSATKLVGAPKISSGSWYSVFPEVGNADIHPKTIEEKAIASKAANRDPKETTLSQVDKKDAKKQDPKKKKPTNLWGFLADAGDEEEPQSESPSPIAWFDSILVQNENSIQENAQVSTVEDVISNTSDSAILDMTVEYDNDSWFAGPKIVKETSKIASDEKTWDGSEEVKATSASLRNDKPILNLFEKVNANVSDQIVNFRFILIMTLKLVCVI